ncbi:hypothetical protein COHA_010277 [Chlorella ohadii]|uniref:Uncharacterized protein n=1 Tax=Chlorella ohadii TaxID=2649997 RepID=A0AAD5DD58_9CHLO|nr:hypothetical protein COHA_010277 [Chlorella ohadii]
MLRRALRELPPEKLVHPGCKKMLMELGPDTVQAVMTDIDAQHQVGSTSSFKEALQAVARLRTMAGDDGDVAFFLDELVTFLSKDEVARQAFSAGALRLVARLQAAADDCASACTRSGSRQPVVELRLRICTALYAGGEGCKHAQRLSNAVRLRVMVHKAVLLAASSLRQQAALVSLLEQQEAAGRPDVQATLAEMRDNLSAVQEGMRDVVADATRVFARLLEVNASPDNEAAAHAVSAAQAALDGTEEGVRTAVDIWVDACPELLPASTELFDGARLALGQAVQRRLLAPAQGMGSVIQQLIRVMLGTALYLDELCIEGDEQHLLSANLSFYQACQEAATAAVAFAVDATPDEVASVLIETTSPILRSLMSQLAVMQSSNRLAVQA